MNELVNKAIIFATNAHKDQVRDSTTIPYILHPLEAGMIVAGIDEDPELIAAAILHDTVEDTPVTKEDLTKEFPARVVDLVLHESENKREELPSELTWDIRKQETIDQLKTASLDVKIVCLGDKLSNIRAMYRDYDNLGEKFWKRFSAPMDRQKWYYYSLVEVLKDLSNTKAYKEFKELVIKTFAM